MGFKGWFSIVLIVVSALVLGGNDMNEVANPWWAILLVIATVLSVVWTFMGDQIKSLSDGDQFVHRDWAKHEKRVQRVGRR